MTDVQLSLAAPFPLDAVSFKPQSVKGNRALAVAYLNARDMMDRFDAVMGVEHWQDDYTPLPDGNVVCALSLRFGGEWVRKVDVGNPSEQPDAGDRLKAAFSDALKRAAVKFGVGRYLYGLPHQWCDYDTTKRCFTSQPQLPGWALPAPAAKASRPPAGSPPTPPATAPEAVSLRVIDSLLASLAVVRGDGHAETVAKFVASYGPDVPTLADLPESSWTPAVKKIRAAIAKAQAAAK